MTTRALDTLVKALKKKPPSIRVGILGKGARTGGAAGGPTNAQVGAWHEFGTTTLPVRSFLRVPLADNLDARLKSAGAFDRAVLNRVIASGSIRPWCEQVAIVAEAIVLEGFDTGGYGKWRPSDMTYKHNAQTLVETGQLRNSISSDVKG
jgi:phage gpG-like protein